MNKRYIFIDGGAHVGRCIEWFEKSPSYSKYPWEIFAFEPNADLILHIPQRPNLEVLNKAIWIYDGTVELYVKKATEASSILRSKKARSLRVQEVVAVDFGCWLKQNFSISDCILVKFDIEGAEYEVLDKMLLDGSVLWVNGFFVEFHNEKVGVPVQRDKRIIREFGELNIPFQTGGQFYTQLKGIDTERLK